MTSSDKLVENVFYIHTVCINVFCFTYRPSTSQIGSLIAGPILEFSECGNLNRNVTWLT